MSSTELVLLVLQEQQDHRALIEPNFAAIGTSEDTDTEHHREEEITMKMHPRL